MMTAYTKVQKQLQLRPKTWLVSGAAGFIGSHLVEKLLSLHQAVVGVDNLCTGTLRNLSEVRQKVGSKLWKNFKFIKGDIRSFQKCKTACQGVDYVLHQAALGSVPRSIEDPITTNEANVTGFLNMLKAAQECGAKRFVYASSSSVYGSEPTLPKVEERIGRPLSPYAVSKYVNELYAEVFARCYKTESIGLRYFNVFGPRQNPDGPYAAVIPRWVSGLLSGEPIFINGDGETSRDFCYIRNVVQANLLAATTKNPAAVNQVFNVACDERTSLNELFSIIREALLPAHPHLCRVKPKYRPFRAGDIRHSQAAVAQAVKLLGYAPEYSFEAGINEMLRGVAPEAKGQTRPTSKA